MDDRQIFAITRPHPNLLTLYMVHALLTGPGLVFFMPLLLFRYHTMRYRFDEEGMAMRWGLLFRREIRLNYSRIQDIHVTSGLLQRWLGLADLQVQTASGSTGAEMTIAGLLEYEAVRDFLYRRMRGYHDRAGPAETSAAAAKAPADEAAELLARVLEELRATRAALEALKRERDGGRV